MAMNPRLLRPRATGYDPAAQVYFNAVAVADGQQLEPAVKKAINDFVVGCKRDGIWSSIKASCLLMGARTLSGALTPLVGTAPTNNNFVSGDYNRKTGLVGNGTTKYLNSNRNASTADKQNNHHISVLPTELPTEDTVAANDFGPLLAARASGTGVGSLQLLNQGANNTTPNVIVLISTNAAFNSAKVAGTLTGLSRAASGTFTSRHNGASSTNTDTSQALANANYLLLGRTVGGSGERFSKARLAFYSIGESLNLALLDSRVSTLYTAIGAAVSPNYADADVNAYINAVEAADGQLLETGVRDAINDFITGCKADGIWTAIKASCILMGARTLSGALTPLVGNAVTNNGPFVSGDYNRKTGLVGNGTTKYLNSNRNANADPQDNHHMSAYVSTAGTAVGFNAYASAESASSAAGTTIGTNTSTSASAARSRNGTAVTRASQHTATGIHGIARSASGSFTYRVAGSNSTETIASESPPADPYFVFARNIPAPGTTAFTNARMSFYSIGESLDLALLDSRVSTLYTAIGAAIP